MTKTKLIIPSGLEKINEVYGNPKDTDGKLNADWYRENIKWFKLPYEMRLSWQKSQTARHSMAHKKIIPFLIEALTRIKEYKGEDWLRENDYDQFGGIFNYRRKRQGNRRSKLPLSVHSWGIAIDINPHLGRLGEKPKMPDFIVESFCSLGFDWGGIWDYPDGMHFQACVGY